MLEKENRQLRARINGGLPDAAAQHGVPSFRTNNGDMSFVEVEAREDDEEDHDSDPTIECQTVCKFVRPNEGVSVYYILYIHHRLPPTFLHACSLCTQASHFGPSAKLIQAEKEMEAKYRAANLAAAGGESEV